MRKALPYFLLIVVAGCGGVLAGGGIGDGTKLTTLLSFAGAPDPSESHCSLTLINNTLYGRTYKGGTANLGAVIRLNTDGTGYQVLHSFGVSAGDGTGPRHDAMNYDGTYLYGMTVAGGTSNQGIAFRMMPDGANYEIIHTFTGAVSDGAQPHSCFAVNAGTLYGMTAQGGSNGTGTLFSMGSDGSGFTLLASFTGPNGSDAHGAPILVGNFLYGMTRRGGSGDDGTIFQYDLGMNQLTLLHQFQGGSSDGSTPDHGKVVLVGSHLYGMTTNGGKKDKGVIFRIKTDGSGFEILHHFDGGSSDGEGPLGSLVAVGTTLYGLTEQGGSDGNGVLFQISTDGSGYEIISNFKNSSTGANPADFVTITDDSLYGMTIGGGTSNNGVVFVQGP